MEFRSFLTGDICLLSSLEVSLNAALFTLCSI